MIFISWSWNLEKRLKVFVKLCFCAIQYIAMADHLQVRRLIKEMFFLITKPYLIIGRIELYGGSSFSSKLKREIQSEMALRKFWNIALHGRESGDASLPAQGRGIYCSSEFDSNKFSLPYFFTFGKFRLKPNVKSSHI